MGVNKTFKIGYNSRDISGFHFHVDYSVPLLENEIQALVMIPGINQVKEQRLHICIQKGELSNVEDYEFLEQLLTFFETIGFKNVGKGAKKILNDDLGNIPDSMAVILGLADSKTAKYYDQIFEEKESKFDLEQAELDLTVAVENEEYEKAAIIRDKIDEFKKQES